MTYIATFINGDVHEADSLKELGEEIVTFYTEQSSFPEIDSIVRELKTPTQIELLNKWEAEIRQNWKEQAEEERHCEQRASDYRTSIKLTN